MKSIIKSIIFVLLIFFQVFSVYSGVQLNNSDLAELEFNNSLILQHNDQVEQRDQIAYTFFLIYLFIVGCVLLFFWYKREEHPTFRKNIMKWSSFGLSMYHIFYFLRVLLGLVSFKSFWQQGLIYNSILGTIITLILVLILWEFKDEVLDDPLGWFQSLFTRWKHEKRVAKYRKGDK